jgi:cytochrome c-type biogenesis protein CcmH/NrfF
MYKRIFGVLAVLLMSIGMMGASYDVARFNKLGKQMICMCGCNQILLECNHVNCSYSTKMTDELRVALERGDSDSLILQSFVQNYGSTVLAAPTTSGFNIVAWIVPPMVFILGVLLAVTVVRTWKVQPVPAAHTGGAFDRYREQARQETEL